MIYLLGLRHDTQFGIAGNLSSKLLSYIGDISLKYDISILAEEADDEILSKPYYRPVSKIASSEYNLEHILCDPNDDDRKKNGIKTSYEYRGDNSVEDALSDRKREQFWLGRLQAYIKRNNILFLLGSAHISTYRDSGGDGLDILLTRKKIDYIVLTDEFEKLKI